jgi:hypothetical protein
VRGGVTPGDILDSRAPIFPLNSLRAAHMQRHLVTGKLCRHMLGHLRSDLNYTGDDGPLGLLLLEGGLERWVAQQSDSSYTF